MRTRTSRLAAAVRAWALLAMALPRLAFAQDAAPASSDAKATPAELDRVIVTARRREEVLQDVPIAVTSLDGEELKSRAAEDLSALSAATPNLVLYNARAFNSAVTATIRGVGQYDPVWGVEPAVGIYIDDVYLARPQAALLDILDVERIEVLRGPQGTLYGKNTIGGAIKYVTRAPEPYVSGNVVVTAGSYDRLDGKALLNIPFGETLRSRFAFGRYTRAGYGENLITGEDVSDRDATVMRATFDWLPVERVDVRLAWDRYRDRSHVIGAHRLLAAPFPPFTPPDPGRFDVRSDARNQDDTDSEGIALTVDWQFDDEWRFKSVTAHRDGDSFGYIDFDTLPRTIATLNRDFHDEQTSQEFQWQWDHGSTHAVAGLYWSDAEAAGNGRVVNGGVFFTETSGAIWTRSGAVYGDVSWDMTAHTTAEVGLRYTHEDKRAAVITRATDPTFEQTQEFRAYFTDATGFQAFSPRIALSWKPTDVAMYYVQATRGFKSGTYNIRADTVAVPASALPLQDETATSYELGAKAQWREGRITLDAALFRTDYRDIQLSVLVPVDIDGDGDFDDLYGDFRNAGQGTMQGVEFQGAARMGEHMRFVGHIAYLDTRYDEYRSAGPDADNARFPNAPDWTGGASAIGTWPLPGGSTFEARLDMSHQGTLYPTTDVNPIVRQPAHTLWNSSLTWRSPRDAWEVALIGQNLSDKVYRTGSFWLPFAGLATAYYGAPRTFALSITYSF
ncbi:TonB-dependent receptor [Lysobacter dokdonensis DS-58]|uniref:TonB-dependent receptor n=1 Tax=Lysobacter dokdonensis DS-58 TaxID=1300345 RepID=A0A0A2WK78_9GAMM|nr:TonB-dependent receptor [Lysobacter dokdonensis]KGQ20596.1 TonB-dependent receptor [Lysobacter dokdonensis DS-58]